MATTESNLQPVSGTVPDIRPPMRPPVVELVGPAAVGKTSLLLALNGSDGRLRSGPRLPKHRHLRSAVSLAPTFAGLHRPFRGLLWKEMKRMTYLTTLLRLLKEPRFDGAGALVLDEGAVYMFARLLVFGEERIRSRAFQRWWSEASEQWAGALDLLVCLDAPDAILIQRLRTRNQPHPVKAFSDEAIARFISSYRAAYERVIASLTVSGGPRVIRVRTDEESLGQTTRRIAAELRCIEGRRT
jgi:hypothetical protein